MSQQQYIDLFRDLEITQEVFNALQNRKLEFSIREASTLGNMRVIDSAYYFNRVSPRISSVLGAFVFSIICAFLLALVRGKHFIPISNPAELEDSKIHIPIVGVINNLDEVDKDDHNERFKQSLESLIVNIQTRIPDKDKKCKTIVLTSPTPLNGKSFVSRNVAEKLAGLGNKVLLIDADYKRGDQHTAFGLKKINLKEFFEINDSSIENYKIKEKNLYVIPRISRIGSSFEFLYDSRFQNQIDMFRDKFDYIIIDTAPLLSVSDTMILLSLGDLRLCVVRHGLSKINEIKQTLALFNQIGIDPDGIIYNCYEKPSSYYGYYGMYGNYSYQYYAKKDICTNHMTTMKRFNLIFLLSILTGCALSPGMHMTENKNQAIYIDSLEKSIKIERLEDNLKDQVESSLYRIGNGDQIEVTVWGCQKSFQ